MRAVAGSSVTSQVCVGQMVLIWNVGISNIYSTQWSTNKGCEFAFTFATNDCFCKVKYKTLMESLNIREIHRTSIDELKIS